MANNYDVDQPEAGMSPGGNRHTQIPAMRLYLDPNSSIQGRGFWTGKYAPDGKASEYKESADDMARLTAFQERGAPHEVVRHFDDTPEEDEETIKSLAKIAKTVTSLQLFSLAKTAMAEGDVPAYAVFKGELEQRAFAKRLGKAIHGMGYSAPNDPAAHSGGGPAGRGKDSIQANRDKRVFNATHGTDDETSTADKEVLKVSAPKGTKRNAPLVVKAIGTKPSEKREKPQKKAKAPLTAKVGASRSGNKTYDYRKVVGGLGEKKSPAESPGKGQTPTGTPGDAPTLEAQPERLANILGVDVSRLQKLADAKSETEFISYFKAKGASFLSKHKVPDSYLSEVYTVLSRNTVKSQNGKVLVSREHLREDITEMKEEMTKLKEGIKRDKQALRKKPTKSLNPKTPIAKLKKRGVTLVKFFKVQPEKLKKGSEERQFAEAMKVSGVNTLAKLATFLAKGYDLSPSHATEMAQELHKTLMKDGAIS